MAHQRQKKYRLRVPDEIAGFVRELHPEIKRRVKAAFRRILSEPDVGKSLRDELKGLKSFKVSRFRIIYRVSSRQVIEIITIGPRKTIYELTYSIVKKESKG